MTTWIVPPPEQTEWTEEDPPQGLSFPPGYEVAEVSTSVPCRAIPCFAIPCYVPGTSAPVWVEDEPVHVEMYDAWTPASQGGAFDDGFSDGFA